MNGPLRRLAAVSFVLFALLLASTTWTQAINADSLRKDPRNSRTLIAELGLERGPIVVGGDAAAASVPVDDQYKYQRTYSPGPRYAHVTGHFSVVSGATGLEATEGPLLTGTSEEQFVRRVYDQLTGKEPQGASVTTTIDPQVQQAATDALGGQRGAVVAIEPSTGAIKAMVSLPSYNPNQLATHNRKEAISNRQELLNDPEKPLVNRAIGGDLYPPGSTFKVVTAAAALESGEYSVDSELDGPAILDLPGTESDLPNSSRRSCGPGDKITLADALRISCNTAFGSLGMLLGGDKLREQADKFGFSEELRVPLKVTPSTMAKQMSEPQEAQSAIGQFEDRVTPLQMAMVAAGIANDGEVMRPYLIQQVQAADLRELSTAAPSRLRRAVSGDTAQALTEMMVGVVQGGTGRSAQIGGVTVAGKTGTAQTGNERNAHAWFISFAPAEDPQIAVAVVVENGGRAGSEASGGSVAAPIARSVMQAAIQP